MVNVDDTSFGIQFIWISTRHSKYIKCKRIATVHVHKSELDFIGKHDIKTQLSLFKTVHF